ncbi:MAG: hypothetical protein HY764_02255 [Candidatus Portnoybacteria bacterium]|nr:hypothetical protein [Candidatus Portnoybacteria bacterium]
MNQINTNELLHIIKGINKAGNFLSEQLKKARQECSSWCTFKNHRHNNLTRLNCYIQNPDIKYLLDLVSRYGTIAKYLEDNNDFSEEIKRGIEILKDPEKNSSIEEFKKNLAQLEILIKWGEKEIFNKLSDFTCLECQRLDEAINCIQNSCFLASTVMAVSAIESRLHYLINKKYKNIYKKCDLNKATLGTLIKIFDKDEYRKPIYKKLKKIIPEIHKPLLDLCNEYRIISAHPQVPSLDHKVAESIINLAFLFLLDPKLRITERKFTKHDIVRHRKA